MVVRERNVLGLPRGPFLVGFEAVRHAIDWQTLVIQHHAASISPPGGLRGLNTATNDHHFISNWKGVYASI